MNEIRPVSIAESARLAAQLAQETRTEQPNPHPAGTPDALAWTASYCRWNLAFSAGAEVEGSA
jgi:hypothetical protein